MKILKKIIAAPPVARVNWQDTLARFAVGDRLLFKQHTQTALGSACSYNSKNGKRFVTKASAEGVFIIRVA